MKKITILFVLILGAIICMAGLEAQAAILSIHLNYNSSSQILSFNEKKSEKISLDKNRDIPIMQFATEKIEGECLLKLYDAKNNMVVETEFKNKTGDFSIDIPYFSVANSLKIFEKSSGKEILSADLSTFLTCNGNGICEFEKGESYKTCLGDCDVDNVKYSNQTLDLLKKGGNIIKDEKTGEILLRNDEQIKTEESKKNKQNVIIIIVVVFVTAAIFIGIIIYRVRKRAY